VKAILAPVMQIANHRALMRFLVMRVTGAALENMAKLAPR